jgi:HD-GYP domain-containing protein (c-di-GMP phosphodiesterase class II)
LAQHHDYLQLLQQAQGTVVHKNDAIETVKMKGLEVSLLSTGDGTETILHKLDKGSHWVITPEEGWEALEYFYILSGQLILKKDDSNIILNPGDSFSATAIQEIAFFIAALDTQFLYVCSRPVFYRYSKSVNELMNLAVSVEEKDAYTAGHCKRIMNYSLLVGEKLNLSSYELYILNLAAFLHDVGKVKIPLEILTKPSKLTDEEYNIMKKHTTYGREILEAADLPYLKEAGKIVEQHHERFDGKGYPHQLKNEEIDIRASIIAVVDSYDAITTTRPYHEGESKEDALEEIKRWSGKMYHPKVVEVFLSLGDKINDVKS